MGSPQQFLDAAFVPGTEAQRKRLVLTSARAVRRAYRRADTSGERLERWLDRSIERKTRIMPKSIQLGVQLYQAYFANVRAVETAMTDFLYTSTNI